ncbi:dTDP-4-dehydrorhamnose 3,5-epimerase [Massilia sp. DWR3-1-1]|uniref:dTDP-4-dehydrorhamnose 3,5-epimerase n=1 Tax=Massilia sp. DWR3-1-1 TaxID=2804559 RepID=UPI003CE7F9D5
MKATPTAIPEVLIVEPKVYGDERGFFYESFNARQFAELVGQPALFVQDDHFRSARDVVRGLHYQVGLAQAKLVRVIAGAIYAVVVDLRRQSPFFGRWVAVSLSAENRRQLWIPAGFAFGSVVTSDFAECLVKSTDYWTPQNERTILWSDAALAIEWPLRGAAVVSAKDNQGVVLANAEVFR